MTGADCIVYDWWQSHDRIKHSCIQNLILHVRITKTTTQKNKSHNNDYFIHMIYKILSVCSSKSILTNGTGLINTELGRA